MYIPDEETLTMMPCCSRMVPPIPIVWHGHATSAVYPHVRQAHGKKTYLQGPLTRGYKLVHHVLLIDKILPYS